MLWVIMLRLLFLEGRNKLEKNICSTCTMNGLRGIYYAASLLSRAHILQISVSERL